MAVEVTGQNTGENAHTATPWVDWSLAPLWRGTQPWVVARGEGRGKGSGPTRGGPWVFRTSGAVPVKEAFTGGCLVLDARAPRGLPC